MGYKRSAPPPIGAEQEALEGNCTPGNEISTPTPAEIDGVYGVSEISGSKLCDHSFFEG